MNLLKIIFFSSALILCTCNKNYAQTSRTYNTKINKADNVYLGNNITNEQKASILLVNKYIRKDKPVKILAGFITERTYEDIKKGAVLFAGDPENIIKLKVVGNNLFINSRVKSIDQKIIAIVKDNKLIVNKGLLQRSSQNFIEVIDDYDIPVLQVILGKNNTIEVSGVFFTESACYIMNKGSSSLMGFKPFALMDEKERQNALYEIRQRASVIKAID